MAGRQPELPGGGSCPCGTVGGRGMGGWSWRKLRCAPGVDPTKLHNTRVCVCVCERGRDSEAALFNTRSGISDGFEQKDRAQALQADLASNEFINCIKKWS